MKLVWIFGILLKIEGRKYPVKVYIISEEEEENTINKSYNTNDKINNKYIKENDYYDLISKYIDICLNCILQIILNDKQENKNGDILVFLPGKEDIEDLQDLLLSKREEISNEFPEKKIEFRIVPLYGSLPSNQQMKIKK